MTNAFGSGLGRLGARALADGTVQVYQGTTLLGQVTLPTTAAWTGRIGVRFVNTGTGAPATNETRFDDFGGGNVAVTATYHPNIYEVGPGHDLPAGEPLG